MAEIEYRPNVPELLINDVEPFIMAYEWLVPDWCNKIVFGYVPDAHWTAATHIYKQYRTLFIDISARWFDESSATKRRVIIHEIIHAFNVPLKQILCDVIQELDIEQPFRNSLERSIEREMEAITEDFAIVIDKYTAKMGV